MYRLQKGRGRMKGKMSRFAQIGTSLLLVLAMIPLLPGKAAQAAEPYVVAPQIAQGYYHGLALHTEGTVYAWGQNTKGQLGNGETAGRMAPVKVKNLDRVKMVAAGIRSSYAIKADGTLWAWGQNGDGQLGDGTTIDRLLPVQITGVTGNIIALSTGVSYHTLALTDDGKVWAWGNNDSGELGDGTTTDRTSPVQVPGLDDVVAIAAGGWHSLALKSDGTVWTWGNNEYGELGDGTKTNRAVPAPIGIADVTSISAGNSHSLAVKRDGTVWSWGDNRWAMLGDGTSTGRSLPVRAGSINDALAVVGGAHFSYALTDSGTVWAWGLNNNGQIGDGTTVTRYAPVPILGLTDVQVVSGGGFSGFAMQKDGTVWGWGLNSSGELGDGTTANRLIPVINKAIVDLTPPTLANREITASGLTHSDATLSWTKAADNLTPSSQLEYRVYRIGGNTADTVAAVENGTPIGSYEADISTKQITGMYGGQTYHYAVVVKDKVGQKSVYAKKAVKTLPEPTYIVLYEGNGNTAGEPPLDPYEYWADEYAEVLGNSGGLEKTDSTFGGWNTLPNGNGVAYAPGDTLVMPAADVTLYARWIAGPDTTAPQAAAYEPAQNAVGASVSRPLSISFNELVAAVAGKTITLTKMDGSWLETYEATDASKVTVAGARVTIHPSVELDRSAEYSVSIEPGAFEDASGNAYAGILDNATWTFTTEGEPTEPLSGDATLASLTLTGSGGTVVSISPAFTRANKLYSASVANAVSSVSVTAATYGSQASVTASVYGSNGLPAFGPVALTSGVPGPQLPLQTGLNRIGLKVTAEDGTELGYDIVVFRESPSSGGSGGGGNGGGSGAGGGAGGDVPTPSTSGVKTTLSGQTLSGVATERETPNGLAVSIRTEAFLERLAAGTDKPSIIVEADGTNANLLVELTGSIVQAMENRSATLEVRTAIGSYRIPAAALDIATLSKRVGGQNALNEVIVRISIAKADGTKYGHPNVVGYPIEFSVIADYAGAHVEIEEFAGYVERVLPIPAGTDSVTTAVVLEPDGTIRHVPTRIETIGGQRAAIAGSLTNSVYALVSHSSAFRDVANHWAKSEINDLASRLIVRGNDNGEFLPGASVTRAEFAALLTRALGLPERGVESGYADVAANAWYAGAAAQARKYGIVEGDGQGKFRPSAAITREEAAVMLARAMKLTGLNGGGAASDSFVSEKLAEFRDAGDVSPWARQALALGVHERLLQGTQAALLPKNAITRAETAVIVSRLLQRSGLID